MQGEVLKKNLRSMLRKLKGTAAIVVKETKYSEKKVRL
jgi:hypothetical protein